MLSPEAPILLLTTGGTIDKIYFDALSDYQVGETVMAKLLEVDAHWTCVQRELRPGDEAALRSLAERPDDMARL